MRPAGLPVARETDPEEWTENELEVAIELLADAWNQFSYNGKHGGLSTLEAIEEFLKKHGRLDDTSENTDEETNRITT